MVTMFQLRPAALLFTQLFTCQVFAVVYPVQQEDKHVSVGESVIFTCSMSNVTLTQISWSKGRSSFSHAPLQNLTSSNFSYGIKIDKKNFSLHISSAQHEDAGVYTCHITYQRGMRTKKWNLTVSGEPDESGPQENLSYIIPPVTGFCLCCIVTVVCCCFCSQRKARGRKEEPLMSRTWSCVLYQVQSLEKVSPPEVLSCAEYKMEELVLKGAPFTFWPDESEARIKAE